VKLFYQNKKNNIWSLSGHRPCFNPLNT